MTVLDNPEHTHIGRALKSHMQDLGVSSGQMYLGGIGLDHLELAWLFELPEPSILKVRRFHYVLIEAWAALPQPPAVCVPFREQWFTTRHDRVLHQNVLTDGRRTAWWWGARRSDRGAGAYCYVCNSLIHPYDLTRGVTHPARFAVMQHRATHIAKVIGVSETRNGRARA